MQKKPGKDQVVTYLWKGTQYTGVRVKITPRVFFILPHLISLFSGGVTFTRALAGVSGLPKGLGERRF